MKYFLCMLTQAKDRAITTKSIVHQADQVIRKLISAKLEELKGIKPMDTYGKLSSLRISKVYPLLGKSLLNVL